MSTIPAEPKIYHILHVDRLTSIIADGRLWCDAEIATRSTAGTTIGMAQIKKRRLKELTLNSHPDLRVGECVPFYFCPRSIMLYLLYRRNHPELQYRGGQEHIVHLEADLHRTVSWANANNLRWAFTLSNAGAYYFEDRCRLDQLDEVNWEAVHARDWRSHKEGKQAEFLVEKQFPWKLVSRIGVMSQPAYARTVDAIAGAAHKPVVEIIGDWYY